MATPEDEVALKAVSDQMQAACRGVPKMAGFIAVMVVGEEEVLFESRGRIDETQFLALIEQWAEDERRGMTS